MTAGCLLLLGYSSAAKLPVTKDVLADTSVLMFLT